MVDMHDGRVGNLDEALAHLSNIARIPGDWKRTGSACELVLAAIERMHELCAERGGSILTPSEVLQAFHGTHQEPRPGDHIRVDQIRVGDEIRFLPAPFVDNSEVCTITETKPDESRPGSSWRRLVWWGDKSGVNHQAGDYEPHMRVTLVRRGKS